MGDEFENIRSSAIINKSVIEGSFNKAVFTGNIILISDSQFREVLKEVSTAPITSIRYNRSSDSINTQHVSTLESYTDQILEFVKKMDQVRGIYMQRIQAGDLQISRRELVFRDSYFKGNEYMRKNDFANSLKCYNTALEINPNVSNVWNNHGNALDGLGRYDEAIKSYNKALEIDPNDEASLYNKGTTLLKLEKYAESLICYDKALTKYNLKINDPKLYGDIYNNRGVSLYSLGRYDEAIKSYNKALEIDPNHQNILFKKGALLIKTGRFDEAMKYFDRILEINPNDPDAWCEKAYAFLRLDNVVEALKCCEKCLAIKPHHERALEIKKNAAGLGILNAAVEYDKKKKDKDKQDVQSLTWNQLFGNPE